MIGLAFLASVSLAKDLTIFVKRNKDLIQVCNTETLGKNYKGDTFLNYRLENGRWIMDHMINAGNGSVIRNFVSYVSEKEVPTYIQGLTSLYYDKDQNEENLVAIFDKNVDSKVKEAWIEMAKKHVRELNKN